jgi:hypothetical protein
MVRLALTSGWLMARVDERYPCAFCVCLDVKCTLAKFDSWFYGCWHDLPVDPSTAPTATVVCCKYQQWFAVMHQDQSRVASFLYGCSQCRWADPPSDLAVADCDDILHCVLEVDSDEFFEVIPDEFFDVYSDEYFLTHEPCWLFSGVPRCEGLGHLTVTVTVTAFGRDPIPSVPLCPHPGFLIHNDADR